MIQAYEGFLEFLSKRFPVTIPTEQIYPNSPELNINYLAYILLGSNILTARDIFHLEKKIDTIGFDSPDHQCAAYIRTIMNARHANLQNVKFHNKINVISIGSNCLPKMLLTKWGLIYPKILGGRTLPFDLLYSLGGHTLKIAATNFKDFLDPINLSIQEPEHYPANKCCGVVFNHESGEYWTNNGFDRLRSRYARRINDFRNICSNGNDTIFVHYNSMGDHDDLEYDLVRSAVSLSSMVAGRCSVISIPSYHLSSIQSKSRIVHRSGKLSVVFVGGRPLPADYCFYNALHFSSSASLKFELNIISEIGMAISDFTSNEVMISSDESYADSKYRDCPGSSGFVQ